MSLLYTDILLGDTVCHRHTFYECQEDRTRGTPPFSYHLLLFFSLVLDFRTYTTGCLCACAPYHASIMTLMVFCDEQEKLAQVEKACDIYSRKRIFVEE
jgi:hypothetical protein